MCCMSAPELLESEWSPAEVVVRSCGFADSWLRRLSALLTAGLRVAPDLGRTIVDRSSERRPHRARSNRRRGLADPAARLRVARRVRRLGALSGLGVESWSARVTTESSRWQWTGIGISVGPGLGLVLGLLVSGGSGIAVGMAIGGGAGTAVGAAVDANSRRAR